MSDDEYANYYDSAVAHETDPDAMYSLLDCNHCYIILIGTDPNATGVNKHAPPNRANISSSRIPTD